MLLPLAGSARVLALPPSQETSLQSIILTRQTWSVVLPIQPASWVVQLVLAFCDLPRFGDDRHLLLIYMTVLIARGQCLKHWAGATPRGLWAAESCQRWRRSSPVPCFARAQT